MDCHSCVAQSRKAGLDTSLYTRVTADNADKLLPCLTKLGICYSRMTASRSTVRSFKCFPNTCFVSVTVLFRPNRFADFKPLCFQTWPWIMIG